MGNGNTVYLTANLTRDPELKFSAAGVAVCNLGLAHNTRKRNDAGEWEDGHTSFFNAVAFRDLGEHVAASLSKGDRVIIEGTLRQRTYEVTEEGAPEGTEPTKRSAVEIVVDAIGPELRFATAKVDKAVRQGPDQAPPLDPDEF